jgi:cytochrome c oxidase cbb3-type subunit 3/ubiquinol-cytochrome c reductase cytochrome c subunit
MLLFVVACQKGDATPAAGSGSAHSVPLPAVKSTVDANVAALDGPGLFATFCAQCHGADAKGYKSDHAPSLVNPTFLATATDAYLIASIEQGRPGTAMAAYAKTVGGPLDSTAVAKIVVWLRDQGPAAKPPTAPPPGDAARGQPLYVTSCLKCHGNETQRGDYVLLANPRFLAIATDAFIYHAIVEGRPTTPMERFDAKLSMQQIADIVAYIRSLAKGQQIVPLPAPTGKEPLFVNPSGKPAVFAKVKDGKYVAADDVKAALDTKHKMVIIDARPESEWMTVHITGAVSIPHYSLGRLDEIPKDATVIAYCACPHHLSGIVVDELQKRGYKHAYVLDEGILEWQRRGYSIVAAQGVTMPPKEPPLPAGVIR